MLRWRLGAHPTCDGVAAVGCRPALRFSARLRSRLRSSSVALAREVEKRHGKGNLGPYDDFEWGMINGKLSALRWVLGDEWDFLDT
jgi:hypothetical protein